VIFRWLDGEVVEALELVAYGESASKKRPPDETESQLL
jgi:hypothetical protein